MNDTSAERKTIEASLRESKEKLLRLKAELEERVLQDITARRREAERLQQLNRTLKAQSRSNQALILAADEPAYLREVCRIIVEDCGHAMVWVGFREDDEAKTVRPAAYSGFEQGYLETLGLTWADSGRGRGPTGTAIRTGRACACRNMLTDPLFLPWREQALKRGYASSIALPLLAGDEAFGALTIYFKQPDPLSGEEVQLLTDLAGDLAYGIQVLRLREAHAVAEQNLRESEERYRSLFRNMAEGFALHEIITDADGAACDYRFLDVNPGFERMTGLHAADVIGRTVLEVLPAVEPHWMETYRRVALTGEPATFESYSAALDRWYEVFAYSPSRRQFAVIFMDVTVRRRADERLREAQKLESIGVLAAGVAHDFNNLLVGVVGSASLAQEMLAPDNPVADLLDGILKTGEQLAHLTRQMLAYAGKGRFLLECSNLSDLIPEMLRLVQPSIPKKIEVRLELERGLPPIEADRSQLQQVFMNLVLNSAEAIGAEPGLIRAKTGLREVADGRSADLPAGRYVYLEVRDTGCGMDDATRARIFDPFFSTKFVGRGLGLAAVGGIVRGHKGAITVTSAPGKGSCFTVLFPAAENTVPVSAVAAR